MLEIRIIQKFILDGNSEHVAHVCGKTGSFENKCQRSDSGSISLCTCAPISELPSIMKYVSLHTNVVFGEKNLNIPLSSTLS